MAKYQAIDTVEARVYDGSGGDPLVIINDHLGELKARKGDYLVGTELGKIRVLSAVDFEAKYLPYTDNPQDAEISALNTAIGVLKSDKADLQAKFDAATAQIESLNAQVADLTGKVGDTDALTTNIADLKSKLDAAEAQAASDEAKLADLEANLKALQAADLASQAAQKAVQDALNK